MTDEALKPCPCCQQDAYVEKRKGRQSVTAGKWYRERVYCRNKKCGLTTATFRQPGQGITAWNTRAGDTRIEALQADKAKLSEEIARLQEALVAEREENLWSAYNTGDVRGDKWTHLYMSDGEWLVRQCGLDPKQIYYKAEQIRNAIPIAARAALQETGQ